MAALSGVAAGAAVVLGWQAFDEPAADERAVSTAELDPLDASGAGEAELVETDGHRTLRIDVDVELPAEGYYEVWLLEPDASGMVSLGVMDGSAGTFDVPADLDLAAFPVVDVSIEPFDGDPAHSGNSLTRGQLEDTET